jgi:hypothetical protein
MLDNVPVHNRDEYHPASTVRTRWHRKRLAELEFKEGDAVIAHVPIRAVPDKVHIINACDESLIYYSILDDANPTPTGPTYTDFGAGLTKQPFIMRYAIAGGPAFWAEAPEAVTLFSSHGNYQVNFTVPPLPDNTPLPAGGDLGVYGNLSVTISGMHSSDKFELCVSRRNPAQSKPNRATSQSYQGDGDNLGGESMLTDTTAGAQRAYDSAIARLTPAERVAMSMEMIAVTDDLLRAGVRFRYPEATGEEFEYQVLRAKYGRELAGCVYGRTA